MSRMSPNIFPHLYVQRWNGAFVIRQRTGHEPLPGPSDPMVRRFDEREDAHAYTISLNTVEERIHAQQKGAHHVNIEKT